MPQPTANYQIIYGWILEGDTPGAMSEAYRTRIPSKRREEISDGFEGNMKGAIRVA